MNILISLPSHREFKNLLATPFFDKIKNDRHKYLIITHSEQLKNIIEPKANNIECILYQSPTKFQTLIYSLFFDRVYETASLRSGESKDQSIFYDRLKNFNKIKYILGLISYCFYKTIGNSLFKSLERFIYNNNFYEGLDVDKVLITNYHSIYEKMIFYSLNNRPLFFFTDGWDALTKQTFYSRTPNVFLLWNDHMQNMLVKNCGINIKRSKVEIVGNPFWDTLPKTTGNNKDVLFFSNNQWVYNEEEILQGINAGLSESVNFSVRLPPTLHYKNKRNRYLTSFPNFKINTMDIDFWFKYDLSNNYLFDFSYSRDLTANNIFIFTGPSTAMLDVIEMGGYVVMICLENMHIDESQWDYRLTCDREVMKVIYDYDKFKRFNSIEGLLTFINYFEENAIEEDGSESNYSSQLYNKIEVLF